MNRKVLKKWGIRLGIVSMSMLVWTTIPIYANAEEEQDLTEVEYSFDNDELYDQYIEHLMSLQDGISIEEYNCDDADTGYYAAKSSLTKYGKTVYESLKEQIIQVANGERASTKFVIPYSSIYGTNETFTFTASELNMAKITDENKNEALNNISNLINSNTIEPGLGNVYDAIVADVPYFLYWSNGSNSISYPNLQEVSHTDDNITVKPREGSSYEFYIAVSSTYAKGDYEVDISKTSVAKKALTNASDIVNQAKSLTDSEKLTYYKNSICNLVDYAFNTRIYSDHRQIIYVFDNDSSTNVVCEGYAKAFKYLCDLTEFSSSEVECRLAAGYLKVDNEDNERHMWNVVQLKNNENYLVDVTNCDDGMFGSPDILFMKGESGKVRQTVDGTEFWGYQIKHPSHTVFYYYDNSNYNNMRSESELILVKDGGTYRNLEWEVVDGKSYWYENNIRQGTFDDPNGVMGDGTIRGREIYDPSSNAWYWLDSIYGGAKACGKEVWMPYIYQDEKDWNDDEINNNAFASSADAEGNTEHADLADQVRKAIKDGTGKWVRYDNDGKMLKGWITIEGDLAVLYPDQAGNRYYYDRKTGLMAKGKTVIDGKEYYFDEVTGVLK